MVATLVTSTPSGPRSSASAVVTIRSTSAGSMPSARSASAVAASCRCTSPHGLPGVLDESPSAPMPASRCPSQCRRRRRGSPRASGSRGSPRAGPPQHQGCATVSRLVASHVSVRPDHAGSAERGQRQRAVVRPSDSAERSTPAPRSWPAATAPGRRGIDGPARSPVLGDRLGLRGQARARCRRRSAARRPAPPAASWRPAGWRRARRCRPPRRRRTGPGSRCVRAGRCGRRRWRSGRPGRPGSGR